MSTAIIFLDVCRILTFIGSGIIIVFLVIHLRSVEKVARPFIMSLIVLFLFEISGAILNWVFNRITEFNTNVDPLDPIYFLYGLGYTFVITSFVYLIFNLEKGLFQNSLIKKRHLITIIEVPFILFYIIGFIILYSLKIPLPFNLFFLIVVGVIGIQSLFFVVGFLYLGIQSTGLYRRNALLVVLGYSIRLGANVGSAVTSYFINQESWTGGMEPAYTSFAIAALFIFIGMTITSYGLLNLYRLKKT